MLVTVKAKHPLYKGNEVAHSIELLELYETAYSVVVGKDLYQVEQELIYIQPDWCLPNDNPLFSTYVNPPIGKSKLGANNRVRAISFNFSSTPNETGKTYSLGLVFPVEEVKFYLESIDKELDTLLSNGALYEVLGLYKWTNDKWDDYTKGSLPSGMYKTDEPNVQSIINSLDIDWSEGVELWGTWKVDGSSMSIYWKDQEDKGICSRTLDKKLEHQSDWINIGLPILNRLEEYCIKNNTQLTLRGEKAGPYNPKNKNPHSGSSHYYCYGVDEWVNGVCTRLTVSKWLEICDELYLTATPVLFHNTFYSYQELMSTCEDYFKINKIEGIVIRNLTGNISFKYINPAYDSNK